MARPPLLLFILFTCPAFAQQVGFGIKGGIRTTNDIDGSFGTSSESSRYVVGPMGEAILPHGFSAEADALYSRPGYNSIFSNALVFSANKGRGTSWEFPLLIKHGLPFPLAHLCAELGYAARRTNGSISSTGSAINPTTGSRQDFTGKTPWRPMISHGLVAGVEVQASIRGFRFAPEIRYTRWNNDAINEFGSQGYFVSSATNQMQVLVGISWRTRR